jgi:CTP-dependent riboflavin kinase
VAACFGDLHVGTLNVDLDEEPPTFRPDFTLDAKDRSDGGAESFGFQCCSLRMQAGIVKALIARTSTNFHGEWTLEIMATEHLRSRYGLKEADPVTVEIW